MVSFGLWMDEWPALGADAGKTVLKMPATSATKYFKSAAANVSGNYTHPFQGNNKQLVMRYSKPCACSSHHYLCEFKSIVCLKWCC